MVIGMTNSTGTCKPRKLHIKLNVRRKKFIAMLYKKRQQVMVSLSYPPTPKSNMTTKITPLPYHVINIACTFSKSKRRIKLKRRNLLLGNILSLQSNIPSQLYVGPHGYSPQLLLLAEEYLCDISNITKAT